MMRLAGGVSPRPWRESLAVRTATSANAAHEFPTGQHCWVRDSIGGPGRAAGLLVESRRRGAGWEGRVVYVAQAFDRPALTEVWLPAFMLDPIIAPELNHHNNPSRHRRHGSEA